MTDPASPPEWSEGPHDPRDRRPDPPPLDVHADPEDGTVTFAAGDATGRWITVDADDVVDLDGMQ